MRMTALSHDDLEPLREALILAGLPADDLSLPGRRFFSFRQQDSDVAFGGIEGAGGDRLLRSLVVLEGRRGQGTGAAVLAALEAFAKDEGVERVHLLTESASDFFCCPWLSGAGTFAGACGNQLDGPVQESVPGFGDLPEQATLLTQQMHRQPGQPARHQYLDHATFVAKQCNGG